MPHASHRNGTMSCKKIQGGACIAIWLAMAVLAIFSFGSCQKEPLHAKRKLILLHTGRLLGNVYPTSLKGVAPLQYYPFISAYVKQVRKEAAESGAEVLLLDSGDSLQGSFATAITGGKNMVTFFNAMRYDAVFLGNLDACLAPQSLQDLKATILCPFLDKDNAPAFPGSRVVHSLQKGSLQILLAANFHGETSPASFPMHFPAHYNHDIRYPVHPARDYRPFLQPFQQSVFDYRIMNWFKFESYEQCPPFVSKIAALGFDLITAHRIYSSKNTDAWAAKNYDGWPVPVSQNIRRNNAGYTVARMDVERKSNGELVVTSRSIVEMSRNSIDPDDEIEKQIEVFAEQIRGANRTVAELPRPVSEKEILTLCLAFLSDCSPGSVPIYSAESIRSQWLDGSLTTAAVYESMPWESPVVRVELTSDKIKELAADASLAIPANFSPNASSVVTSSYLAALIKNRFSLPDSALFIVREEGEFRAFLAWLSANPQSLSAFRNGAQ